MQFQLNINYKNVPQFLNTLLTMDLIYCETNSKTGTFEKKIYKNKKNTIQKK